ncbi:MAG: hypothetical protein KBG83_00140 [Bacteroidetes bacterium]|nr:hypothetical protein [Bacteroidota bacterium]
MDIKKLILELKKALASITGNEEERKKIETQISELEKMAIALDESKNNPPQTNLQSKESSEHTAEIEVLSKEITAIKELLLEQQKRAENAEAAIKEQHKTEFQKKIEEYKKKIVTEGKITPAELKEKWETLLNSEETFEAASKIIEGLPVNPATKKSVVDDGKQKSVGIMKSASPVILEKVLEYTNSNTN